MSEFVIVTGLSGAGRSTAVNVFEDQGWFVIDNLPPSLVDKVAELAQAPGSRIDHVALGMGSRAGHDDLSSAITALRGRASRVRVVFLDASDETLIRRYEDTRRRHPMGAAEGEGISGTIERERTALEEIKAEADVVVDTTDLNVHQLKGRITSLFGADAPASGMQTTLLSFGYKHGLPLDVDLVFDCRFLPNPHWVDELRPQTGLDGDVRRYVLQFSQTGEFLARLEHLLDLLLPAYVKEGKSYLSIGLGCTGGRHRSVVMVEELARMLRRRGFDPAVSHRDVGK